MSHGYDYIYKKKNHETLKEDSQEILYQGVRKEAIHDKL